uniref:2-C-methyl-D-erythritol 2,4-cyclodiphosphate synthase n=1 Tax=Anthurium amnicola TaxID=1678845 RepID=A0A1D1Z6J5_9ARAE
MAAAAASLSLVFPVLPRTAAKASCVGHRNPALSFPPRPVSSFPSTLRSSPAASVGSPVQPAVEEGIAPAAPSPLPLPSLPFRVGHGFDLHRLEPGLPLIIGGVDIPHDRGCEAHSDGDVLLHCVVDAILGALGLPDIGQIFPDSDPKWRGAASSVFVKEAVSCGAFFPFSELM